MLELVTQALKRNQAINQALGSCQAQAIKHAQPVNQSSTASALELD
jgi:hypothetical protein